MNIPRKTSLLLVALLIALGLVAATATPASAKNVPGCKQLHTVQSGEYLVAIARKYDTDWRALAELNDLRNANLIYPGQSLCVSLGNTITLATPPSDSSVRVYVTSVEEDKTVTLKGRNLAAESKYTVYLRNDKTTRGPIIQVGTVTTNEDGTFKVTYNIPKRFYDVARIKVTISDSIGDTADNWFYNATSDSNTGGIGSPAMTFKVESNREDKWVKIRTSNLPANMTFKVFMGKVGSEGVTGAIQVGTIKDSKGGAVTVSIEIPEELQGRSKLDIRLESEAYGIASYLTFENNSK